MQSVSVLDADQVHDTASLKSSTPCIPLWEEAETPVISAMQVSHHELNGSDSSTTAEKKKAVFSFELASS